MASLSKTLFTYKIKIPIQKNMKILEAFKKKRSNIKKTFWNKSSFSEWNLLYSMGMV